MMTIRLQNMTDEEYKQVTKCVCPVCGSDGYARTSYGNITSSSRCVDVVCDSCGAAWSIYAPEDGVTQVHQKTCPSAKDVALDELLHLSDNKLRRMKKGELIAIALDIGEDDVACLNKPEMIEALIAIRNEVH